MDDEELVADECDVMRQWRRMDVEERLACAYYHSEVPPRDTSLSPTGDCMLLRMESAMAEDAPRRVIASRDVVAIWKMDAVEGRGAEAKWKLEGLFIPAAKAPDQRSSFTPLSRSGDDMSVMGLAPVCNELKRQAIPSEQLLQWLWSGLDACGRFYSILRLLQRSMRSLR